MNVTIESERLQGIARRRSRTNSMNLSMYNFQSKIFRTD